MASSNPSRATSTASSGATAGGAAARRLRPLSVDTPAAPTDAHTMTASTSPILHSPVRRLSAVSAQNGSTNLSPKRKSALFSGLPLTELLEGCRGGDGTLGTPDLRRLHTMIQARHGGAYSEPGRLVQPSGSLTRASATIDRSRYGQHPGAARVRSPARKVEAAMHGPR